MPRPRKNAPCHFRAALGAFSLGVLLTTALGASAQAKVLAKVNGVELTDEDMKLAEDYIGPSIPRQLEGKARENALLDYLIEEQLVVQEAQAEKLSETPDFAKRLAYLRDMALMEALFAKVAKEAATDAAIKQTYEEAAKNQKPETEYHALHILVGTEEQAKAVQKRIKDGEDFSKIATEVSKDLGPKGGDLGWHTKDDWVPEFGEAVAKMEAGQISDPVKSQFGWHIIKLEEKRAKKFPPFDQVRGEVARFVVMNARKSLIGKLRQSAKIERTDAPAADSKAPADAAKAPAPAKMDDKKK
jgi:peptidyl-prolyl cis-trans isomerase C